MACVHLREYKATFGLKSYSTIYSFFIAGKHNPKLAKPIYHQVWVACFACGNETSRVLGCLHCVYLACYEKHASEHSVSNSHHLFVEMSNGYILCYLCKDYVYDSEFEEVASKHNEAHRKDGVRYVKWQPNSSEDKVLKQHSKRMKLLTYSTAGMRGLINLGSTCFMSCIMQALLHTPMLRDYFFTDKHKCYSQRMSDCLVCHFSRLFQNYYTDDPSPLSLHEILYLVWQNARHLSRCGQKDAHEFFAAILNLLHQFSTPDNMIKDPCTCIIDVIFHGKMQSDVVCQSCGNVSTTVDPIWDISLDIPDPPAAASLIDCLHHYTRAEPLGPLAKIKCAVCQSYQESTKQLTFRTLPIVIVIHLKRHDNARRKKKTMFVPFPIELDMSPFMSGCRNLNRERIKSSHNDPHCDNRYTLYAVIVHSGTSSNSGHYFAYIKEAKQMWFECNDVRVKPAELEEVMRTEGYLLFYHKTVLTYD